MRPGLRWSLIALVLLGAAAALRGSFASEQAAVLGTRAAEDLRAGELDLARQAVDRALRWHPHDAGLWRQDSAVLGTLAFLRRDPEAAQASVQAAHRAWAEGPNDGRNAFTLGWALLDAGQTAAAQAPLLAALRLDPHNQSYLYALGLRSELAGVRPDALKWYRAAWTVYPDGVVSEALARLGVTP